MEPVRSVLHDAHVARSAEFVVYSGWTWIITFGDPVGEYDALRNGASMWDVYGLQKFEVVGSEASLAVQRVFANDVLSMQVGQIKYGPFVNEDGAIVDDGTVFKHSDERFWVMANSVSTADYIREHVGSLNATIHYRTHDLPDISVQGPTSREVLQRLTSFDLSSLKHFRFVPERVEVAGVPVWISRSGFTGDLGFELIPDPGRATDLWNILADEGVVAVGMSSVGVARIEAGLVIIGNDYEPLETSPFDPSMDRVVATGKDLPILGMDVLRSVAQAPPRRLKTLRVAGEVLPGDMSAVWDGDSRVGTLTSPAESPMAGLIGLAVLDTPSSGNGTQLQVDVDGGRADVVVDELSVFDPNRSRQRM